MDSKSVCSRRSLSSRRSTRSTRSTRSSRGRLPKSPDALINGLDELDLRIAAVVAEGEERKGGEVGGSCNVRTGSNKLSNSRDSPACLITNIMQMNRRDTPSKAGHRRLSSGKSVSGRSVRSSREARAFEIARTILRQVKDGSTVIKNNDHDDYDTASVVSTFSTVEILGDLTDNEDSKSIRSMRSRSSRRSRSRSKSRHRKSPSSTLTSNDSPRVRRGRSKSVTSEPSGLIVSESKSESERLYDAFMKNLSREEMIAHDTKVLSTSSNVRAELSAARMSRKTLDDDRASTRSRVNRFNDWFEEKDLFPVDLLRDGAAKSVSSRFAEGVKKSSLSRASSAPESIFLSETNSTQFSHEGQQPDSYGRFQELPQRAQKSRAGPIAKKLNRRPKSPTTRNSTVQHNFPQNDDPFDSNQVLKNNIDAFATFAKPSKRTSPRFTFSDKTNCRAGKSSHMKEFDVDSPVRDAISVRQKSLPKTSENSFVPRFGPKATLVKSTSNQWSDFNLFNSKEGSNKERKDGKHRKKTNKSDTLSSASRRSAPDFFKDKHQFDNSSSANFYSDPFSVSVSSPEHKHSNAFASDFQGFGKSTKFESIPSGWEAEESEDDETRMRLFANTPKNALQKSAFSDGSPSGIAEFDSEWPKGGNEEFPKMNLFSERNLWP